MTDVPVRIDRPPQPRPLWPSLVGTGLFLAVAVAALNWAKWTPYAEKIAKLTETRLWPGSSILDVAGAPRSGPSWRGAWEFTVVYARAVWPALVAGILVAAAVEALLPRRWLLATLTRRSRAASSAAGAAASLPSLMCSCCTAPVAVTLRRNGAPVSAALAYWLGNPVLNPAVLVFLAIVAPWQWVATRLSVGLLLVVAGSALVARLADRRRSPVPVEPVQPPGFALRTAPRRLVAAVGRLSVTLLPEYGVIVFLLGLFRGWLFPLDANLAHWGVLAVLVAALLGTVMVIPTAGEIPIVQGLVAAGAGAGVAGALLITLPAISAVSMAMVLRTFGTRVVAATAGVVLAAGLLAGAVLWALSA